MRKKEKATVAANPLTLDGNKDKAFCAQYQIVYRSFKESPKTMLDVFWETGILRANICRYVVDMENKGLIQLLYKKEDKHTQCIAGYYTTDKALFRKVDDTQLKLWEVE